MPKRNPPDRQTGQHAATKGVGGNGLLSALHARLPSRRLLCPPLPPLVHGLTQGEWVRGPPGWNRVLQPLWPKPPGLALKRPNRRSTEKGPKESFGALLV